LPTTVLIVDDEYGLADIIADLLRELGYDVEIAINGQLGLASLLTRPANIVVVDLMMPVMDGPEMIRRMRADPALANVPIIMMTALPEGIPDDDSVRANAVLVKPFSFTELVDVIERLLRT
jgi:DNA-binding response OmpR family regulator